MIASSAGTEFSKSGLETYCSTSVSQVNDESDTSSAVADPQKVEILSVMFSTIPNNIVCHAVML